MTHKGTITIETERLILRRFNMNDAPAMFNNWAGDSDVTRYLQWKTHESVEESETVLADWIPQYEKDDYYVWAVVPRSCGEPVGSIAVVNMDERTDKVHIGYCIGKAWWHQGIVSEAFAEIIPFLFDEVKVNRIESRHDPHNPNSGKVMMKCGLKYEGTLRQSDFNNQGIVDASMYALLRSEYRENGEVGKA